MNGPTKKKAQVIGLLLPAVLLQAAIGVYPLVYLVWISFHRYRLARPGTPFVGIQNYAQAISSGAFMRSLGPTLIFSAITVTGVLLLGFGIAHMLNKPFRGSGFLKAATILPWSIPYVAVGLIWATILNGQWGLLNKVLEATGLLSVDQYIPWLASRSTAMAGIAIAQIWRELPFAVIFFLAGLQTIPSSLYDAARIDGAGALRAVRFVTIPLLRPVIAVVAIYQCFMAFTTFDIVYAMTGGGPGGATELLSQLSYRTSFLFLDLGRGAALAILLTLLLLVTVVVVLRLVGFRRVE